MLMGVLNPFNNWPCPGSRFCFQIISESITYHRYFWPAKGCLWGTYTDCSCSLPYYSNYFVYEYVSCTSLHTPLNLTPISSIHIGWFTRILLRFDWSAPQRCHRVHESYGKCRYCFLQQRTLDSNAAGHTNGCHQMRQWRNYDLTISRPLCYERAIVSWP